MAVTADVKGTAILRNKVADYLNTEPGGESAAYHLMNVFGPSTKIRTRMVQKHYTSDKAATKLTSGYAAFPITGDQYLDNDVSEFIRDIAEEQQIGVRRISSVSACSSHRQQGEHLLCAQVPRIRGSFQHHRCRRRDHLPERGT